MPDLSDVEISKIVGWVANKVPHPDFISFDDLFQEGWVAALSAKKSFDSSKNTKLSTWIVTVVYGTLQCYVSDQCKKNSLPDKFKEESEKRCLYNDLIQDRIDVSLFLSLLKKILSPMAFEILAMQLKLFPKRIERSELSAILSVDLLSVDNLYGELRWAVLAVQKMM